MRKGETGRRAKFISTELLTFNGTMLLIICGGALFSFLGLLNYFSVAWWCKNLGLLIFTKTTAEICVPQNLRPKIDSYHWGFYFFIFIFFTVDTLTEKRPIENWKSTKSRWNHFSWAMVQKSEGRTNLIDIYDSPWNALINRIRGEKTSEF